MANSDNTGSVQAINVAVVGHTNAGKTSLIRTLLRDDHFGQVNDAAGTTRVVEKSAIFAGDDEVLSLYDTPGFEDSSALLQVLEELAETINTRLPVELLQAFIARAEDYADFEQEIKVLRQSVNSDVLLYIIDVREPLLGKYSDEIEILSLAGKPILPVFNFIAGHATALTRWREQMAQFNLHAALEFDTVAFDFEAEKRLYQKLQSLLEQHYDALQALIDYRQAVWENLKQAAAQRIFRLITEVTCYRLEVDEKNGGSATDVSRVQDFVRDAEQKTLRDCLAIFRFTQLDIALQQLPVTDGRWELDIFSPQMLKDFGLNAGATVLKGAAAGAGIDLMVGGLSLGAATMLGALLGGGWAIVRRYQQELKAAWQGHKWLCVDDNTISLLFLRQQKLLHTLTRYGHAMQKKVQFSTNPITKPIMDTEQPLPTQWYKDIKLLHQHPQWQYNNSTDADYIKIQCRIIKQLSGTDIS